MTKTLAPSTSSAGTHTSWLGRRLSRPPVKRYLFVVALVIPSLPYLAAALQWATGWSVWWWIGPVGVFGLIGLVDWFLGDDRGNPSAELMAALQQDRYYRRMTYAYLPLMYGSLLLGAWLWVHGDLSWFGRTGLVLTMGIVTGIGINTAHELGHKRESLERWLAKIALAPSGYGHFFVEHNYGHHVRVATPLDPASARLGESLYAFLPRTLWFSLVSAVRWEWRRFRVRGRNPWTWRNNLLHSWAMTVVLWSALVWALGPGVLGYLLLQAGAACVLLETVNYIEHYGLLRAQPVPGRYEPVDPRHSWNSDRLATNMFLFQLQRHSDHHANPTRRYQALQTMDVSPQLPNGYAAMVSLAWFPPLWRAVMDPRVLAHYDGDVRRAHLRPGEQERVVRRVSGRAGGAARRR